MKRIVVILATLCLFGIFTSSALANMSKSAALTAQSQAQSAACGVGATWFCWDATYSGPECQGYGSGKSQIWSCEGVFWERSVTISDKWCRVVTEYNAYTSARIYEAEACFSQPVT